MSTCRIERTKIQFLCHYKIFIKLFHVFYMLVDTERLKKPKHKILLKIVIT